MTERDYYHLDESGGNKDDFENEQGWWCYAVHEGDNVNWNHVVSAANIAVHTPQGTLSLPSYEKKNTSVLTGTIFSKITSIWIMTERVVLMNVRLCHLLDLKPNNLLFPSIIKTPNGFPDSPIHPKAIKNYRYAVKMMVCGVSKHFTFMTGVFSLSSVGLQWMRH